MTNNVSIYWQNPFPGSKISIEQGQELAPDLSTGANTFFATTDAGDTVLDYVWIAGPTNPGGLTVNLNNQLANGIKAVTFSGTGSPVSGDTTTTFVIRAYANTYYPNSQPQFVDYADATYQLEVTTIPPTWITANSVLANILDGNDPSNSTSVFNTQVSFYEPTVNSNVLITLVDGNIPPGMTIDNEYIRFTGTEPSGNVNITGVPYLPQGFANTLSANANSNSFVQVYNFTLNLSDGTYSTNAAYAINVYAREFLTADQNLTWANVEGHANAQWFTFTADSDYTADGYPEGFPQGTRAGEYTFPRYPGYVPDIAQPDPFPPNQFRFTAGSSSTYGPQLLNPPGLLGNTVSNDFYAYRFDAQNIAQADLRFYLADVNPDSSPSVLPLGMTLDPITGYIYGYAVSNFDQTYTFTVYTQNSTDPAYESKAVTYNLFVYAGGPVTVIWNTPTLVGSINNGETSEFTISANLTNNDTVYYTQTSGDLPPGLVLSETGLIVGTVIFDTPAVTTTYEFTVQVTGTESGVEASKLFRITVTKKYQSPFNDLYCFSYGRRASQNLVDNILQNYTIMSPDQIYRFGDPNFGVQTELKFLQATNLIPRPDSLWTTALSQNHYRKVVNLGPFKNALAKDINGRVIYEVVYSPIIDNLVNEAGQSVPRSVPVYYPDNVRVDGQEVSTLYPNSLVDMRTRVYSVIGQANDDLPRWMGSVQADKSVLGFTAAWVVCYALPGYGDGIAYRLNQTYGTELPFIDFDIDRYELDDRLTYRYDANSNVWINSADLFSTAVTTSGNVMTVNVLQDSLIPALAPGDMLSWTANSNVSNSTSILGITQNTPVILLNLGNAGHGYSTILPPRVTIAPPIQGDGKAARANAIVNVDGTIDSLELLESGYGYHTRPQVTIEPPPDGNEANSATATAEILVSPLVEVGFVERAGELQIGIGYTKTPNVYVQVPTYDPLVPNFSYASNTANIRVNSLYANGGIKSYSVDNNGTNYTVAPFINIEPSTYGNDAQMYSVIQYQIELGNVSHWATNLGNIYLFNKYSTGDELYKYYLFPKVNVLE